MKNIFTFILLLTVLKGYSQDADTAEIYFDYNLARISNASSMRLDSFRFARILVPGHKTTVYGYTDVKGSDDYNKQLSIARAKNVRDYLISLGLDERDIVHCEGKGKARTDQEEDKDRKVLIIMERAPSKYAKAKEAAAKDKFKDPNSSAATKSKTPKTGELNPSDSAAMAAKAAKKTGAGAAALAAKAAKKASADSAMAAKAAKKANADAAALAAKAAKKASADSAALAAKAAKKASADAAALAAKAAKKASADSAATAAKATKKAEGDAAALAAKAAKKASADSAATAAKAAKKATADAAALAAKAKKASADSAATAAKAAKKATADAAALAAKAAKKASMDSAATAAKVAKTKNPKSDGSKPGTATAAGTTTGNSAADGTAPVPVVLGESMGNTSPTTVASTANTSTAAPPGSTAPVMRPKLPAPEPVVPLSKDAKIARKQEKNIATLDPKKLIIGDVIPLNNIYFAPASNEMLRQSEPSLEQLFKFLKTNTNLAVEIQGRICCLNPLDGTDEPDGAGSTRSTARAKNIYDYLVTKGIDKSRLSYSGLGNTKPSVYPERTEFDRDLNRRATMKIIYK